MNIFLVPYTWIRHVVVALNTGGAALLTWYAIQIWIIGLAPTFHGIGLYWNQAFEGTMFLSGIGGMIAFTSVLAEGSLRRRAMTWRMMYAVLGGGLTFFGTVATYLFFRMLVPYMSTEDYVEVVEDASLVTLRYTLALWALAGVMSGLGPYAARKIQRFAARAFGFAVDGAVRPIANPWSVRFAELFFHTGGGFAAAVFGAAAWQLMGQYREWGGDLYLASAAAAFIWGFGHGLLTWGIPDDLYAGWIRILSAERYGLRIPIDKVDGTPSERFVGHFPRGLDMYMPAEHGVAELHTSFVVDRSHHYAVRGLSIQPTVVKRFLERINLGYDPRRPAPLETQLKMGDRILMGVGKDYSEVEFLLLPKEER
ncbi:MAG: hypothetical protein H6737_08200 [Alphaproteobacteria bacterium]|nr:hypothetical protein [Alphaproteobacteria bacterium]